MVVQTLRSIGGYMGAVAGTPVRMITPTRLQPRAGERFLRPLEIVPPRISEFGLSYTF